MVTIGVQPKVMLTNVTPISGVGLWIRCALPLSPFLIRKESLAVHLFAASAMRTGCPRFPQIPYLATAIPWLSSVEISLTKDPHPLQQEVFAGVLPTIPPFPTVTPVMVLALDLSAVQLPDYSPPPPIM